MLKSRDLVARNPLYFSAKFYDASFPNGNGGGINPPPPPPLDVRDMKYAEDGRG